MLWQTRMAGAWDPWLAEMQAYRSRLAALIAAPREDCVVPKNSAGQGMRAVLNTYDTTPRVIATAGEFDSIDVILREYAHRGKIELHVVASRADGKFFPEDIRDAMADGVDLLVISHVVFNTGQVLLGWLAAFEETGQDRFADAARRAACYLAATLDADGHWRRGNSRFARADATLYNTRTAWALAEAGVRLDDHAFTDAAARSLRAAAGLQAQNGWLPHCCLSDPEQPLLHTLAYAIRGLLEGGRVLGDRCLLGAAERAASALVTAVRADGWMPGRYRPDWSPGVRWSCLTGQAQMVNDWIRLGEMTGDPKWLGPVPAVLEFLKRTQNRRTQKPGVRGGVKGAWPVGGAYGAYEVLSWATKFFADALMRHEAIQTNGLGAASTVSVLA